MKLSIIIPVYNVEKYIEECTKSIQMQGLQNNEYEIILINDGSTDNSKAICENLVAKNDNIYLFNQQNSGQSVARNVGIKNAKGEYILFVDSDDYLKHNYLKDFIQLLVTKDLDFIGFGNEETKQRNVINDKKEKLLSISSGNGIKLLENHQYYNGPCWYIFKKSILGDLRFDEDRLCEDAIFTSQILLKVNKGEILRNKIYCYYENPESTVRTVNISRLKKINEDMFYVANRFKDIISQLPESAKDSNHKAFIRLKDRQESFTFFALVRFLKRKENYSSLKHVLVELEKGPYPAYPIYYFKGYNNNLNKMLIYLFNSRWSLKLLIKLNQILSFIK